MNNLYIHPNNQKILWNAINSNPQFKQLRSPDLFFKSVINTFYEKNRWVNDKYTLDTLNRETIQYMINVLKGVHDIPPATSPPVTAGNYTRDYEVQQRENVLIGEYNRRLQDYNTEKQPPPVPTHLSDTVDKPLSNMDELIQQQMKLRQQDMNILPQISGNTQQPIIEQSGDKSRDNTSILEKTIMELKEQLQGLELRLRKLETQRPEKENIEYIIEEKKDIEIAGEASV